MNPDLIAEVKEWIELDPDPQTATQLQEWLDAGNLSELQKSFSQYCLSGIECMGPHLPLCHFWGVPPPWGSAFDNFEPVHPEKIPERAYI